ncbi:MAG: hypothetical protein NC402_00940 [Prevotella sp.]|nr:hypothetical protein [Prevotella sp.]MCM1074372.1 hypothetical protein [Ruminococcus sp.]
MRTLSVKNSGLRRIVRVAMLCSMLFFAVAWCVWALYTPLMGDDAVSTSRFNDFHGAWNAELRYAWGVWNHCNARTGDMLSPLWTNILPQPVTAVLIGIAVFLTLWGMLRLSRIWNKPWCAAVTLAAAYIILPWRDLDFYVCHFNYVWGTALFLPILSVLFDYKPQSRRWLWCLPIVFTVTATHEALGFPAGAAFIAYWLINRRHIQLSCVQKWWIAAILAGALFCITSPASYRRMGSSGEPDLPLQLLLVQTLPTVLALSVRIGWLILKRRLRPLLRTRWLIFTTAAIVSAGFTIIGGIEGRGGWYAQIFAIMALAYDLARSGLPTATRKYAALISALACNVFVLCFWCLYLMPQYRERQAIITFYAQHPNKEQTAAAFNKQPDDWEILCLPLIKSQPIYLQDSTLYYNPDTQP